MPEKFHQPPQWELGQLNQVPTILSLLTPEYQHRYVQRLYHQAHGQATKWSAMHCRPEGFMRAWFGQGQANLDVNVVPEQVRLLGSPGNLARNIQIDLQFNTDGEVLRLGSDSRR